MTNAEKYRDKILEIAESGCGLALLNGKVVGCKRVHCDECDFYKFPNCDAAALKWIFEEAPEPDWANVLIDTKILVSINGIDWEKRHFAGFDEETGKVKAWNDGNTSWSTELACGWKYARLYEE